MMILNHLFLETEPGTVRINLNNHFGDSQGTALTYSASVSGSAISVSVSGNTLSITQAQGARAGEVTITVRAMNSGGAAEQDFMARTTGMRDLDRFVRDSNYSIPDNYRDALMFGNIGGAGGFFDEDVVKVNLSPGVVYDIYLDGFSADAGTLQYQVLELLLGDTGSSIDSDSASLGESAQLQYATPNNAVAVVYALRMDSYQGSGTYRLQITSP